MPGRSRFLNGMMLGGRTIGGPGGRWRPEQPKGRAKEAPLHAWQSHSQHICSRNLEVELTVQRTCK